MKESFFSILPITLIVIMLHFAISPLDTWMLMGFLVGVVMLFFGMSFFTLGADMSMMPVGQEVGAYVTKKRNVWLLLGVTGVIGVIITIAEPDLLVLANQFTSIKATTLIIAVGIGVGLFLMIAMLRIVLKIKLIYIFWVAYGLLFLLALFVSDTFVPVAFDSGGVTTGPMTVPVILALGLGVASARGDKSSQEDSFGLVALCSIGPILAVLLLGLFNDASVSASETMTEITNMADFWHNIKGILLTTMKEIAIALLPIVIFFALFEIFIIKESRKMIIKTAIGFLYTYFGLVIFLAGAHIGFMPVGNYLGAFLGALDANWLLIPLGMLMGFFVVMAEPAVHVLNKQVEEITVGAISKRLMLFSLAIGVAISIGLAMMRVVFDFSIWWIIVPGYLIALLLPLITPKIFTAIGFDSGGVASGPMTATFLLPLATGACSIIYQGQENYTTKMLTNGFGIVALVAMTPLIVVQILGFIYQLKMKIHEAREKTQPIMVLEDIIEFAIPVSIKEDMSCESTH